MKPFYLFSSYYQTGNSDRQAEIDFCLHTNIESGIFSGLFYFLDEGVAQPVSDPRVRFLELGRRPTYMDWLAETAKIGADAVSVYANSDIYFDQSIGQIERVLEDRRSFIALSRWEDDGFTIKRHENPKWSQDVWAVRADLEIQPWMERELSFPFGVPRCDNKVSYVFATRGWKIYNPCDSVKSLHLHNVSHRGYNKKLDSTILGGVAYVDPSIDFSPSSVEFDVWVESADYITKVGLNRSIERWAAENPTHRPPEPGSGGKESAAFMGHAATLVDSGAGGPGGENAGVALEEISTAVDVHKLGTRLVSLPLGHAVIEHKGRMYVSSGFSRSGPYLRSVPKTLSAELETKKILVIPPHFNGLTRPVSDKPSFTGDFNFWQYPCATERQAFNNHFKLSCFQHIDIENRQVNSYVPLPWATYIDAKTDNEIPLQELRRAIDFYRDVAAGSGFKFRVHTVCQHIHWSRLVEELAAAGVTDLHISHNEVQAQRSVDAKGVDISLHSWPLIAPNLENSDRTRGLEIGRPVSERRYLASFVGAHMRHYRSDDRLKLKAIADAVGACDVFVRVNEEWHFEKNVYKEQMRGEQLNIDELDAQQKSLESYNRLLSDTVFSLCPEGAGPNTLRLWESLGVGAIPVIFGDDFLPPSPGGALNWSDFSIQLPSVEADLFDYLKSVPKERVEQMQRNCLDVYQRFRGMVCF